MQIRKVLAWSVLAAGVLAITYTYAPSHRNAVLEPAERKPAPDFQLPDSKGAAVKLSDYAGKAVLVNLWATWCAPCRVEIPWFIEFEQKYKDQGFAVIGVALDEEGWRIIDPYVAEQKMNYRVLLGDEKMPAPYSQSEALPTTYLIDRQGRIAATHVGLVAKATYQEEIEGLLRN